ncbi:MAG: Uma2 family endonuclease [Sphingomonas sp.]
MATALLDPAYRPITAEEFLEMEFGEGRRAELENGVIYMMTGGTAGHALIQGNILTSLGVKLRGSGCRPYGPDLAVKVGPISVRFPDVSVYCGHPFDRSMDAEKLLGDPRAVFEVLSPSTSTKDQTTKLGEYRALAGIDTIVFVDPKRELVRIVQRVGIEGWRDEQFENPHDVDLPSLGITLSHAEIFARD